jgi:DNA repair photolyase
MKEVILKEIIDVFKVGVQHLGYNPLHFPQLIVAMFEKVADEVIRKHKENKDEKATKPITVNGSNITVVSKDAAPVKKAEVK